MLILVINVGSTSLKFKLFRMPKEEVLVSGRVEGIGQPQSSFAYGSVNGHRAEGVLQAAHYENGIAHLTAYLLSKDCGQIQRLEELSAVGFKTVLAKNLMRAAVLDADVISAMEEMSPIAPTHNPPYIDAIRAFQTQLPSTPMIGLFEPAFHRSIPEYAWRYALPYEWTEQYGIRRYGFHGASHRYAAERAGQMLGREDLRLITCHLGGSSSVNATRGLTSLDNSFGLSPQSGLIHSGRPGDVDVTIPLWMIETLGMSVGEVRTVLSKKSGLVALSGLCGEMREIAEASEQGNSRATLAIEAFVYQVRRAIGAASVVLGGVDAIVFTGGIGERSADIRKRCCDNLQFLGLELDHARNTTAVPDADIAAQESNGRVLVIEANEELIVARACVETLAN